MSRWNIVNYKTAFMLLRYPLGRCNPANDLKEFCGSESNKNQAGFTLLEILVVLGLIAALAGIVVVAVNPARQFALARNTQRLADLSAILSAIAQNTVEHKGKFECSASLPEDFSLVKKYDGVDLRPCLVPVYLAELPVDPSHGQKFLNDSYDSRYEIRQDKETSRITLRAVDAELGETIEMTR